MTTTTISQLESTYISGSGQAISQKGTLGELDFKDIMSQTSGNQDTISAMNQVKEKKEYENVCNHTDEVTGEDDKAKDTSKTASIKADNPEKSNLDSVDEKEESSSLNELIKKTGNLYPSEIQDKLSALGADIKNLLIESFQVSEEDLKKAMETLGIGYLDLLNPENLSNLALKLTGSEDMISLVTNEEICIDYINLLKNMNELVNLASAKLQLDPEEMVQLGGMITTKESEIQSGENSDVAPESELFEKFTNVSEESDTYVNENTAAFQNEADVIAKKVDSTKTISVTRESEAHANQDLMVETQKDGSFTEEEESGTKFMNADTFTENLINQLNTQNSMIQNAEYTEQLINTEDIIKQIVDEIKVTIKPDVTSMELQLNPENLGKLTIHISSKEELVTAQIIAQNNAVKEALEGHIAQLRENLSTQGVKVDAIEVTVESHQFESNMEQNNSKSNESGQSGGQGRRQINLANLGEEEFLDLTERETLAADIMIQNGNSVDFIA